MNDLPRVPATLVVLSNPERNSDIFNAKSLPIARLTLTSTAPCTRDFRKLKSLTAFAN
jgi:hypothetical protein